MSQRIHLRDLRYYIFTGLLFGGINGVFASVPKLIKNLWKGAMAFPALVAWPCRALRDVLVFEPEKRAKS